METAARFRLSPRRRRAAALEKYDARVGELEQRQGQMLREMQEARDELVSAGHEYQAALTRWHRDHRGSRPADPRPSIEQRIADLQADYDAITALIGETLEDKAHWISRNRSGLVRDVQRAADEAQERYRETVRKLLATRQELIDLRADEILLRLFGHEASRTPPDVPPIPARGLGQRLRELMGGQRGLPLDPESLRHVFEEDARVLRDRLTQAQREALKERGEVTPSMYEEALWADSEEYQQQVKSEVQRRREAYRAEWGTEPPW